jgi:hypothetical protein
VSHKNAQIPLNILKKKKKKTHGNYFFFFSFKKKKRQKQNVKMVVDHQIISGRPTTLTYDTSGVVATLNGTRHATPNSHWKSWRCL